MRPVPLLLLSLLSACQERTTSDIPVPLAVEVATVTQGTNGEGFSYPARIAYDREVALSPRIGGLIRAMPITVSQRLRAGALVIALDATPYRAALARADADARRTARKAALDAALVGAGATAELDAKDAADVADAARASRAAAAHDLASARVIMPFAGVVLTKSADIGSTVAAGQSVATVADLSSPLIARVSVPLEAARDIRLGRQASVSVGGQRLDGHVIRVGAAADTMSGTVEVVVKLAAAGSNFGLVSGAAGSVRFAGSGNERAGVDDEQHIPAEALVDADGSIAQVFLVDRSGNARLTAVRLLGPSDDGWRVSGLPASARVITAGAGFVADGQRVSVSKR